MRRETSEPPTHLLQTLTDTDWDLIIVSLHRSQSRRGLELSKELLKWRQELTAMRAVYLEALAQLH